MVVCHRGLKLSPLQEVTRNSFFQGERGALKPVAPFFCPQLFSTIKKRGRGTVGPKTKRNNGTKRHKLTQNGTNFGLGNFLAPFSLFVKYSIQPHPLTITDGRGTPAHPPDNDTRSGERLVTGYVQGANMVASASSAS